MAAVRAACLQLQVKRATLAAAMSDRKVDAVPSLPDTNDSVA